MTQTSVRLQNTLKCMYYCSAICLSLSYRWHTLMHMMKVKHITCPILPHAYPPTPNATHMKSYKQVGLLWCIRTVVMLVTKFGAAEIFLTLASTYIHSQASCHKSEEVDKDRHMYTCVQLMLNYISCYVTVCRGLLQTHTHAPTPTQGKTFPY